MNIRYSSIAAAAALLLVAGSASAQLSVTAATSPHNLSNTGPAPNNSTTAQVCVFCHTPHGGVVGGYGPLWNKTPGALPAYTMYDSAISSTLDMQVHTDPEGVSLACLSCHDGSIAVDQVINPPNFGSFALELGAMTAGANGFAFIDIDLSNDHPISIEYNPADDPGAFVAEATVTGTLPLFPGTVTVATTFDQVECATCHNVHDNQFGAFLRVSNAGSALCTTCHVK